MSSNSWINSIYSDGSASFVSKPEPEYGDKVCITMRVASDAPVTGVVFRYLLNGNQQLRDMSVVKQENGFTYYGFEVEMVEPVLYYHFYVLTEDTIYYYTQIGITTYLPDESSNFRLLAEYRKPAWVQGAVFYQIFTDRFANGDPSNDVRNGEYTFDGHETIKYDEWNTVPLEYEDGHCLDFYGGDLEGIREKLPYFKELGVTALYLNPIFYAATNHKYDCLDYFHVDPHFGGDEAFARLCEAVHANGMHIVLDVSINHTGIAHKWFNRDAVFFDKSVGAYNNPDAKERKYYFFHDDNSYEPWLGVETLPNLNYASDELREILYRGEDSLVRKWLKPPYCIDGWRFDVADVMAKHNRDQFDHEVWKEIYNVIKETNPQAYILAEDWGDVREHLNGDEWDSAMNYISSGRCIRQFTGEVDLFSSRMESIRKVNYRMTAEDLKHRVEEHFGRIPQAISDVQFNLFDSHDTPRLHNREGVKGGVLEGAVEMLYTLPGAVNLYYGDELDIEGTITSNEGARYPMPWDRVSAPPKIYDLYRKLSHMKQESRVLREGGFRVVYADGYTYAHVRFLEDKFVLFVWSMEDKDREIEIPLDVAANALSPDELSEVTGKPLCLSVEGRKIKVKVPARSGLLIEHR